MMSFFSRIKLVIICFIFLIQQAFSQKTSLPPDYYKAAGIPETLKKNADYVTRYDFQEITAKDPGKATVRFHYIVTLLNEKADSKAALSLGYDKMLAISNPEMKIYDADGNLLKRYKKSDMYNHAAYDGMTLLSDNRVLSVRHSVASYPVTIEQSWEYNYKNGYLDLSNFYFQNANNSVQEAICVVRVSPELGFRYKTKNIQISPEISTVDGLQTYKWVAKNLLAIKPEVNSEGWQILPRLSFACNIVEFGDIKADFSTWKGFGLWQQELNKGLSELSPARAQEIKQMVAGLNTDKEKARFLYEYMQKNMRYVGIQLGIGGWQPFPATFVDQKKYGDCKALSNYMHALLKAVDIPSNYAIIRSGANEEPADADFVYSPFNHVVLCVPLKGDTVWLECTSNTALFGKLGTFTENRNALLITEEGGKLVNTPKSTMEDNLFESETVVDIDKDGIARAKVRILSSGEFRNDFIGYSYLKNDIQKEKILKALNIKQPDIFEMMPKTDKDGVKAIDLVLEYEKLHLLSAGNKLFYKPVILDLWTETYPVLEKRNTDFFFPCPAEKKSKTVYKLPDNMELESLPANDNLKFMYGSFVTDYSYDKEKNEINAISKFELNNHVIPAAQYNEMQQFIEGVSKSAGKKMVLKKKG